QSPDQRNVIQLEVDPGHGVWFSVSRDEQFLIESAPLGLRIAEGALPGSHSHIVAVKEGRTAQPFHQSLGKSSHIANRYSFASVTLDSEKLRWQIELRAYDDGVALRYRVPVQ